MSRILPSATVLVPVTAWSLNFTVTKYALTHGFLPLAYNAPRFVFASVVFSLLALQRERTLRVRRRDLLLLTAAGVVGVCFNQLTFVFALRHDSAATVALLFGTIPIFVALLSHLTRHESLRVRQWTAAVVSCGGVVLVVLGASGGLSADPIGIFLALAAPLTWAIYSVSVVPLLQRYSPLRINAIVCTIGTVPLVAASISDLSTEKWDTLSGLSWGALIYGTVVAYVLATLVWLFAIKRIGAPRAALYQNLQPFLGALFALILLSERLTFLEIAGAVIIGSGIAIAGRAQSQRLALAETKATL